MALIHGIILGVIFGLTKGAGVLPDVLYEAVGGNVMFTTTVDSTPTPLPIQSIEWAFDQVGIIVTSTPTSSMPAPGYEGRVTVDLSTGSLELRNVSVNDSGTYTVTIEPLAGTLLTGRTILNVLEIISHVSVESSTARPVEGQPLNLTCDASGSVFTTEWMKDGSNLNSNDNIMFYDNNTVLSFKNLHRNDRGIYTCRVSNPVSSVSSTYTMVVNYGPENVQISGPGKVDVGTPLTLSCSADSTPTATYTWKHNGTVFHHSSEFTKNSTGFSDSGEYICQATNSITDKTDSKTLKLEVTGASGSKCDPGCIVGIVFGCLAVILLVAALVLVIVKKKYLMDKFSKRTSNRTEGEGQDNATYGGSEELNYADVKFFKNRNGGKVQVGQQNEVSEYAAVRVNNRPPTAVSPPTYNAHMERTKGPAPQPNDNEPQYAQVRRN